MEHIIKVSIFFENSQALFENFILPVQSSETVASVAEAIKGILISRHASDFRLRGDFDVEVFADTRPTRKTSFKPKKVASAFRNSGLFIEELMAKIGNIRDEESGFVIAIVKPDPRLVATLQSSHKVSQKSVIDLRSPSPSPSSSLAAQKSLIGGAGAAFAPDFAPATAGASFGHDFASTTAGASFGHDFAPATAGASVSPTVPRFMPAVGLESAGTAHRPASVSSCVRPDAAAVSLHTLLNTPRPPTSASASPFAFMDEAATWPCTRVNVFATVGREIEYALLMHDRKLDNVRRLFAVKQPALARGAFGVVYKACLNVSADSEADMASCRKFPFSFAGDATSHQVPLVLKTVRAFKINQDLSDASLLSCWSDKGECIGDMNEYREVILGRFLNRLVKRSVTPHFPLIYEFFQSKFIDDAVPSRRVTPATAADLAEMLKNLNSDRSKQIQEDKRRLERVLAVYPKYRRGDPCSAFVTEMCHMTFTQYLDLLGAHCHDKDQMTLLLDVAVLQVVNGLMCAHKHFNFRHNDMHANNVMMTYITSGEYRYVVDGKRYHVPNFGMCWKLIDFGFGSSTKLFGPCDNAAMLVSTHALKEISMYDIRPDVTPTEMYDLTRFLESSKSHAEGERAKSSNWDNIFHFFRYKLQDIISLYMLYQRTDAEVLKSAADAAGGTQRAKELFMSKSSANANFGFASRFFHDIAKPFLVERPVPDAYEPLIFNAEVPLFHAHEPLSNLEGLHYTVNSRGDLVPIEEGCRRAQETRLSTVRLKKAGEFHAEPIEDKLARARTGQERQTFQTAAEIDAAGRTARLESLSLAREQAVAKAAAQPKKQTLEQTLVELLGRPLTPLAPRDKRVVEHDYSSYYNGPAHRVLPATPFS